MSDQDPTSNEIPPQDAPQPAAADNSKALQTALTGVAGMLLGGLLLGKRGGLLAGLVGVGAKVLLEKSTQAAAPTAPAIPTEPAPPEPDSSENVAPPSPPAIIAPLETSVPVEPIPQEDPTPEPVAVEEIAPTPVPEPEPERITAPIQLAEPEPEILPIIPTEPEPVEEIPEPEPSAEVTEETPAAEIPAPLPPLTEIISDQTETSPLDPLTETLPAAEIAPIVEPEEPADLVADSIFAPPAVEPIPASEAVEPTETLLPPTTLEVNDAPVDIELDEVIRQVEAFRNYGQSEPAAEQPPANLSDFPDPLLDESAWVPPISPSVDEEPTVPPPTQNQDPLTETSDDPAFVNWPKSPVADEQKSTAFQSFVATMFSELAEPEPPQERPTEPIPATAESSFIPSMAAAIASDEGMEPPIISESAAPFVEVDSPATPTELTPEDIWRLAAEEVPVEKSEPISTIAEFPIADPILTESPTAHIVPAAPSTEEAHSLPTFHSFAAFAAGVAETQPSKPAEPTELAPPGGMDKFVELFGTSAEQTAENFFKTAAPFPSSPFSTPETPTIPEPAQPFEIPTKRSPFLTPDEETELSKFQLPSPAPAASEPTPVSSIFQEASVPEAAPAIAPISFPVAGNRVERYEDTKPKGGGWKLLFLLLFLGAVCGGYIYRDQVLQQWHQWFPPPKVVAPPAPPTIEYTAPPAPPPTAPNQGPKAVPAPVTPPVATPETTTPPAPAVTSPLLPTIDPPPVLPPQPAPTVPTPMPAEDPAPAPAPPPTPEPPPAKIEVRPAATLPELPATPEPIVSPTNEPLKPEDAAQQAAMNAVKSFLSASSTDQLLEHVLNADTLKTRVEKYYPEAKVTPTQFDNIVLDSGARVPETNSRAFLFRVRSPDRPQGFPVCTEETPKGYKIEWEAFIQCRDRAVEQFWKTPTSEPASLFVVLKRSHYFEDDMPDIDSYECFRVNSPNPDEGEVYAFARKDSAMVKKNRALLIWDANYFAVARFAHVKNSTGKTHVEIIDIDRFNWRSQGR